MGRLCDLQFIIAVTYETLFTVHSASYTTKRVVHKEQIFGIQYRLLSGLVQYYVNACSAVEKSGRFAGIEKSAEMENEKSTNIMIDRSTGALPGGADKLSIKTI